MKIFLDTANLEQIKYWAATGLLDGVTTNPTHLSKESGDIVDLLKKICNTVPNGDISIEVTETQPEKVYEQAKTIAAIAENVTVKIPCHKDYYDVIKTLTDEKISINVTLVFTLIQGLLMCKMGVKYISPFIGRWDDIDVNGIEIVEKMRFMIDEYEYETQIIAASIRNVKHFHEVLMAGADVATIPVAVLEKAVKHPLTDIGIKNFMEDWKKLEIKQFP